ncbi:MAG: glycosyltransferase [Nitrospira sp.]|nr:MAG: glycosyltransferase [Nitrospira sp.]
MKAEAATPAVTVVIVPRERFSETEHSLESVLERTKCPHQLIYVDGGSPARVRRYLENRAVSRGFRLMREDRFLMPNQARNIGWQAASTPYVVFVDNDVVVSAGWLDALLRCAEETGAWLVSPTICIGTPLAGEVHMAGGRACIHVQNGRRTLSEKHRYAGQSLAQIRPSMRREPTELVEFHTVLVRRDVFQRVGSLDERLMSTREHVDLSLAVQEAGGSIYFEPDSVVTYIPPPPFAWFDYPFFLRRWSESWNIASLRHFRAKWRLGHDDPQLADQACWLREHRHIALAPMSRALSGFLGERFAATLSQRVVAPIEIALNKALVR